MLNVGENMQHILINSLSYRNKNAQAPPLVKL